jgi:hypothetical protein
VYGAASGSRGGALPPHEEPEPGRLDATSGSSLTGRGGP